MRNKCSLKKADLQWAQKVQETPSDWLRRLFSAFFSCQIRNSSPLGGGPWDSSSLSNSETDEVVPVVNSSRPPVPVWFWIFIFWTVLIGRVSENFPSERTTKQPVWRRAAKWLLSAAFDISAKPHSPQRYG